MAAPATVLDAALAYLARGWSVFPIHSIAEDGACTCGLRDCTSPGKHPASQLAPRGVLDATRDPSQVEEWWSRYPQLGVAIATGPRSGGLLVVDIDLVHSGEESLNRLEEQHGPWPETATVRTGYGLHYYFQLPPGENRFPSGVRVLGEGIDIRAEGGYVVAPPSRHATGVAYEWLREDLREVPAWLALQLVRPLNRTSGAALDDDGPILESGRNTALTSKAGAMRRQGFSEAEIFDALWSMNQRRCRPPLGEREVQGIAHHMQNYSPAPEMGVSRLHTANLDFGVRQVREALSTPLPEKQWLWHKILPERGVSLFVGAPKVGKTLGARNLARAVVDRSEEQLLGRKVAHGKVFYLSLEDSEEDFLYQFQAMGLPQEELGDDLLYHSGMPPSDAYAAFKRLLEAHRPRLVIADTLVKLTGLKSITDYGHLVEKLYPFTMLVRSQDYPCHLMYVHHAKKDREAEGVDLVSGGYALSGEMDSILLYQIKEVQGTATRVLTAFGRGGVDLPETPVYLDPVSWRIMDPATYQSQVLTELMEAVVEVISLDEEVYLSEVITRLLDQGSTLATRGVNELTVSRALRQLVIDGRLTCEGKGIRADPYRWSRTVDLSRFPALALPQLDL